ncbi:1-phosphofructokinase family hexose kinase [Schlesneria sp. DSM 10557]|uniref:1-phosphofructokinase family hexose kinase n=1 Tax=Schlesneria sp. DSM 10557 TaxID=3044399 RepID=UPI0035A099DA
MILAAGLTPAWQQVLSFSQFVPGEVNRAHRSAWCGSGKVLNVGAALHQLGASARTLCLVGGPSGELIAADFARLGASVRWIRSQVPTRTCTTILDETTRTTTELVENSHPIPEEDRAAFLSAFAEESRTANVVVLSGSLPESTPADFYRQLLEQTTAKAVLDIRGAELEAALPLRPFVVKPNREELSRTVGREMTTEDALVSAMSEIRDRGAAWVVVSQGEAPLLALGPDGLLTLPIPQVNVINPIGCGDCLAAGIAAGIDQQYPMRQCLEIGIRAAVMNAQELLPARNLTKLIED